MSRLQQQQLPVFFAIYFFCTVQLTSGFPQPFLRYADGLNLPQSERLALCFSQWTALSNHPQISSFAMDLCSSIFNNLQGIEENNQEIVKRFLFHYSRAQDPTYPLNTGDNTSTLGRPFFLFRPRNGRKAEDDDP